MGSEHEGHLVWVLFSVSSYMRKILVHAHICMFICMSVNKAHVCVFLFVVCVPPHNYEWIITTSHNYEWLMYYETTIWMEPATWLDQLHIWKPGLCGFVQALDHCVVVLRDCLTTHSAHNPQPSFICLYKAAIVSQSDVIARRGAGGGADSMGRKCSSNLSRLFGCEAYRAWLWSDLQKKCLAPKVSLSRG